MHRIYTDVQGSVKVFALAVWRWAPATPERLHGQGGLKKGRQGPSASAAGRSFQRPEGGQGRGAALTGPRVRVWMPAPAPGPWTPLAPAQAEQRRHRGGRRPCIPSSRTKGLFEVQEESKEFHGTVVPSLPTGSAWAVLRPNTTVVPLAQGKLWKDHPTCHTGVFWGQSWFWHHG